MLSKSLHSLNFYQLTCIINFPNVRETWDGDQMSPLLPSSLLRDYFQRVKTDFDARCIVGWPPQPQEVT
jgi:hypothetical protein